MWRLLKTLGFIIGWLLPFGIVYYYHVYTVQAGYDVDMFGILIAIGIIIGLFRTINNKVEVWTIQDKHKIFILSWNNSKKIMIALLLTWVMYTIEDDIVKIQITGLLISGAFIVGFVLSLLGELLKKKKRRL